MCIYNNYYDYTNTIWGDRPLELDLFSKLTEETKIRSQICDGVLWIVSIYWIKYVLPQPGAWGGGGGGPAYGNAMHPLGLAMNTSIPRR